MKEVEVQQKWSNEKKEHITEAQESKNAINKENKSNCLHNMMMDQLQVVIDTIYDGPDPRLVMARRNQLKGIQPCVHMD